MESCEQTKHECTEELESRKVEFNTVKREINDLTSEESLIVVKMEELDQKKNFIKQHCDKMKIGIKHNRDKWNN